jgi:hypothetical protein
MRTFSSEFTVAKNKAGHAPINLLEITFPAVSGFPELVARLADKEDSNSNEKLTVLGNEYHSIINSWGDLDALVFAERSDANATNGISIEVLNVDTDLLFPKGPFSKLFDFYPPETAIAKLYQWFGDEGLTGLSEGLLFVGRMNDPISHDDRICRFDLVDVSSYIGDEVIGRQITTNDYPNAPTNSIGKTLPIVIGTVDEAPGIPVRKANETALTQVAFPGATTLSVASTSGFKNAGQLVIGQNVVTYTGLLTASFTGVSGINRILSIDTVVIEKVNDHRYVFADPQFPIQSISNIRVAGETVDSSVYTIDPVKGEVIFADKPQRFESVDTKSEAIAFTITGSGNTALNPENAFDANNRTSSAKINQTNRTLSVKHEDELIDKGEIQQVFLRVEHFEEEKLPNDSISISLPGIGTVKSLSLPASEDLALTEGSADASHSTSDSLGFATDIDHSQSDDIAVTTFESPHTHSFNGSLDETINPTSGNGITFNIFNNQSAFFMHYPAYAGDSNNYTVFVDISYNGYAVLDSNAFPSTVKIFVDGKQIYNGSSLVVYPNEFPTPKNITSTLEFSGQPPLSIPISVSTSFFGNSFMQITVHSITVVARNSISSIVETSTGISTDKSGGVLDFTDNNRSGIKSGQVSDVGITAPLAATTEKSSNIVQDFADITEHVTDWEWFTNREAQITYNGSSDGRTSYILNTFFEIHYAERQVVFTDDVSAQVVGLIDDGSGTITGTPNAIIERPDHVYKWSALTALKQDSSLIDDASFASVGTLYDTQITGGYKLAGIIQDQKTASELWSDWGRNCRSYLFWDLGQCRLHFRPYNFIDVGDPSVKTISDTEIRNDPTPSRERTATSNLVNSVDARYKRDWTDSEYSAIASKADEFSKSKFGLRERPDQFNFDWVRNADMASDLADFYLQENSNPSWIVRLELFLDNMELEPGDIVKINSSNLNLINALGLVLGPSRSLGSGRDQKADSIPIAIRLFPAFIIRVSANESGSIGDDIEFKLGIQFEDNIQIDELVSMFQKTSFSESATAQDSQSAFMSPFLFEDLDIADGIGTLQTTSFEENFKAVDRGFTINEGYGVQSYGLTGYGGAVPLNLILQSKNHDLSATDDFTFLIHAGILESVTVGDSISVNHNTALAESVAFVDVGGVTNDGYGTAAYGTSTYGGQEIL